MGKKFTFKRLFLEGTWISNYFGCSLVFFQKGSFSDIREVSLSVLLSCGEIRACLSLCSSCSQPSVKASVGVSPLIKLLVQVAPFAATCSNCECEKAVFIEQLTFRFGSADCCCHFCSCHNLGQKPELGYGWLHISKINLLKQKIDVRTGIGKACYLQDFISVYCIKI